MCIRDRIKEIPFDGKGRVLSYTVVHDAPEEYKEEKPYVVALIELENGVRVISQLVCDPEEVEIGMEVKKAFRKYGEDGNSGIIYYGTKFVPDN